MEAAERLKCERVGAGLVGAVEDVGSLALKAPVGGFQPNQFGHLQGVYAKRKAQNRLMTNFQLLLRRTERGDQATFIVCV